MRAALRAHAAPCAVVLLVGSALFGRVLGFDFEDVPTAVERALALGAPDPAYMHLIRGIAYARRGELQRAEPDLRRAVALDEQNPAAWGNLARLERLLGRPEESRRAQQKADELRKRGPGS